MAIQTISTAYNPISGVFGTGQVQVFATSGTWTVPPGIGKVRARMWGGGGATSGSGGGFSLRTIYDLSGITSIAVTVGAAGITGSATGGTSSFGSYCSATGGAGSGGTVGAGSGGDINNSGGLGNAGAGCGGGVASIVGNGGSSSTSGNNSGRAGTGGAGGGGGVSVTNVGGPGFLGLGAHSDTNWNAASTSGLQQFSIDFIGMGGGGAATNGINGSGGGNYSNSQGGIPGGGGNLNGAIGMVIVEW